MGAVHRTGGWLGAHPCRTRVATVAGLLEWTSYALPTHMVEVYKAAWTRAAASGDFTDGVFLDVLASSSAAAAYSEGDKFETARDLYLGLWRQQVPPHRRRSIRRGPFGGSSSRGSSRCCPGGGGSRGG
jgi:hypothetical protein